MASEFLALPKAFKLPGCADTALQEQGHAWLNSTVWAQGVSRCGLWGEGQGIKRVSYYLHVNRMCHALTAKAHAVGSTEETALLIQPGCATENCSAPSSRLSGR